MTIFGSLALSDQVFKKVIDWMTHSGGVSPKEIAMKARVREG